MQYKLHVKVTTKEQFETVLKYDKVITRIYVLPSLIPVSGESICASSETEIYLCSPFVFRRSDIKRIESILKTYRFDGFLCSDHEFFGYINNCPEINPDQKLVLDNSMYILNHEALDLYVKNSGLAVTGFYNSFELNNKEISDLNEAICKHGIDNVISSYVVYGRIPMMISANCVKRSSDRCDKSTGFTVIKDRMGKSFPVYSDCGSCVNVIYNSVPLSLHKYFEELHKRGDLRLDMTDESLAETEQIINYFSSFAPDKATPYKDYTSGHIRRGVE